MLEYKEEYRYLSSACLNLTDACNLRCRYCFVEQNPHYMTLDIAKQAVDFLVSNLRWKRIHAPKLTTGNKSQVTFFGGEPTLMWDEIIVPLVEYVENTYPDEVLFSITTNGTLLTEEKLKFMKEKNFGLLLSIDGAKKTQDYNRPCANGESSFDLLMNNIPKVLEYFPNVTFRATIEQQTVSETFENFLFAVACGFKNIFMIPNGREQWSQENKEILQEELQKIYWYFANYMIRYGYAPIGFKLINESFNRVYEHDKAVLRNSPARIKDLRPVWRCGLGTSFGSIGYDGSIYGCQEQDSKTDKTIFYIGDIFNGINEEKHLRLLNEYYQSSIVTCENKELCSTCKLGNICNNWVCPSSSWDIFKSFFIDSEIHCLWQQYAFDNAIVLMNYFVSTQNKSFQRYLETQCGFPGGESDGK